LANNIVLAEKYDVAISTACPGLDNIVVEKYSAAKAGVELLRRENLGVANFMIMVLVPCYVQFSAER
jgi:chromosome segregation ATPase